jgi:hypothetical protein
MSVLPQHLINLLMIITFRDLNIYLRIKLTEFNQWQNINSHRLNNNATRFALKTRPYKRCCLSWGEQFSSILLSNAYEIMVWSEGVAFDGCSLIRRERLNRKDSHLQIRKRTTNVPVAHTIISRLLINFILICSQFIWHNCKENKLYFIFNSGVLEEAEFYNITELIKLVKERVKERDAKQSQVKLVNYNR